MKKYLSKLSVLLLGTVWVLNAVAGGSDSLSSNDKKMSSHGADRAKIKSVTFELELPNGAIAYDGLSRQGSEAEGIGIIAYSDMAAVIIAEGLRSLYGDDAANEVLAKWFVTNGAEGQKRPTYLLIEDVKVPAQKEVQHLRSQGYGFFNIYSPWMFVPQGPPGVQGDKTPSGEHEDPNAR